MSGDLGSDDQSTMRESCRLKKKFPPPLNGIELVVLASSTRSQSLTTKRDNQSPFRYLEEVRKLQIFTSYCITYYLLYIFNTCSKIYYRKLKVFA